IVSISAIMTLGLISCSVHSRRGSRGVGKLSESGLSRIADTSLDLGKGCGSSILSNNQTVKGLVVNDHQIEGREIFWSLKLKKGIGFEIGPISQVGQGRTRGCQCRVSDQQIQIEGVPQTAV